MMGKVVKWSPCAPTRQNNDQHYDYDESDYGSPAIQLIHAAAPA